MISGDPLWDIINCQIRNLNFQVLNCISFEMPDHFGFKELWDIDQDGENRHRDDVEPGLSVVRWKMKWVTNSKKPFNTDGNSHEDGTAHTNVGKGIDEVREGESVDIASKLESPESVVDPPAHNVKDVKGCKGDE